MSEKTIRRSEVPVENTWALEDLYRDDAAWEQEAAALAACPAQIAAFAGRLGDSGEMLCRWYDCNEQLGVRLENLVEYACRRSDVDTGDAAGQAMKGRAVSLAVSLQGAEAFSAPEIMAIPEDRLEQFYRDFPALEKYRRALQLLRRRAAHVLSPAEEKLLAAAGEMAQSPDNIGVVFRNADLKFPDVTDGEGRSRTLTQGSYIPLMEGSDRTLRRNTFETFYHTWQAWRGTSAAILDAQLKQQTFFARARHYKDNMEAALFDNEVPVEVYHNLIETVHRHMPSMYRYMALRKKILGVDELHMYDLYATLVAEADDRISFDRAKEAVLDATSVLGKGYTDVLKEAFGHRWIDVYENEGKRSGAYSSGARPHPYVLLNQKDTLDSQFTLVHEMGHAMHSYLSMKNQPPVYSDYVIFVAEVASTCNEVLLMRRLLSRTQEPKKRAYLINYFLEQFRTTLYRQTMFAEFEWKINRLAESGESLTADVLDREYYALNKLYYGDGMTVDPEIAVEWARIPHFFYDYYVFQYATGFSAAVALADRILTGGEPAVKDYLRFLSSGCTADPISLLRIAGVDMATPAPVDAALGLFDELLTEMEQLMA